MTLSSLYLHWDTTLWHLLRVRMVQFTGEYKQEKQENIDAYLTAVGMPWIARKTAGNITPALGSKYVRGWGFGTKYFPPNFELEVTKNGDEWTMTWKSTMMSSTAKFTIGVEFVEKNPRGKEIKVKSFMIHICFCHWYINICRPLLHLRMTLWQLLLSLRMGKWEEF